MSDIVLCYVWFHWRMIQLEESLNHWLQKEMSRNCVRDFWIAWNLELLVSNWSEFWKFLPVCHALLVSVGLRSAMGAGYSMMNDLTIIQTTQVSHELGSLVQLLYPHPSNISWFKSLIRWKSIIRVLIWTRSIFSSSRTITFLQWCSCEVMVMMLQSPGSFACWLLRIDLNSNAYIVIENSIMIACSGCFWNLGQAIHACACKLHWVLNMHKRTMSL